MTNKENMHANIRQMIKTDRKMFLNTLREAILCPGATNPIVEESLFKGNPMICMRRSPEDRYPHQIGLSKAKLVVACVEQLKEWIIKQDNKRLKLFIENEGKEE